MGKIRGLEGLGQVKRREGNQEGPELERKWPALPPSDSGLGGRKEYLGRGECRRKERCWKGRAYQWLLFPRALREAICSEGGSCGGGVDQPQWELEEDADTG